MKKLKKFIANPIPRVAIGFALMGVSVPIGAVFLPFVIVGVVGMALFFMWGQYSTQEWFDGKEIDCPICGEKTSAKLVKMPEYAYIPIPFIGRRTAMHVNDNYFLVCGKCLENHVGENDLTSIMIIANGNMAHAKKITEAEFDELVK